jgi:Fe2+ or Zn2+ uptake regulation protein
MQERTTKYRTDVLEILKTMRHATNSEIHEKLKDSYPALSATTVHRVTNRLLERGVVSSAPSDQKGSKRYDINPQAHDHFICSLCGRIRDLDVAASFIPKISKELGGCSISGRLVIHGECDKCKTIKKKGL